jgi:hypothetical protein
MSSDLEKYLKNQRPDLDVETPDDQIIWEGIRKDLGTSAARTVKKKRLIQIRNIAAVAIIVISVGYMMGDLIREHRLNKGVSLASLDKHLGEREKEYKALVDFKMNEVGSYNETDNIIIAELLEEIQKLDTIYEQTLKDLGELGYNEKVINMIFETYEKKIYLLELIILENNKIKKNETDESIFL